MGNAPKMSATHLKRKENPREKDHQPMEDRLTIIRRRIARISGRRTYVSVSILRGMGMRNHQSDSRDLSGRTLSIF